jgi:CRISPR system Cascade subunit CasC
MKIETHLIQNFVPSCLNRDDTNQPKDCEFGGVRRARISSQCIKQAVRRHFNDTGACDIGTRTKRMREPLLRKLADSGKPDEELSKALDIFLAAYYSKPDTKRPEETAVLLFISDQEVELIGQCVLKAWDELMGATKKRGQYKKDNEVAQRLKQAARAPDIALFGRMLAEFPDMKIDAACQVAHAISTHKVDMDMDFYTAVDDLNPSSETGAGMMGVTGFNSACFYRYALIDRGELVRNLGGDAALADQVIEAFLFASVHAIPTGKQNSMAAQNPPSFGMFVVRRSGVPCSLANAFAEPVRVPPGQDEDLIGRSVAALASYWTTLQRVYGSDGVIAAPLFHDGRENRLGELASWDKGSVQGAVAATMEAVRAAGG